MLFIRNDMVEKPCLDGRMHTRIDALEHACRQVPSGRAIPPLGHRGANDDIFAMRMKSDVITRPRDERDILREDKYCAKPGTYCGLIMLFTTRNGEPLRD